MPSQPKASPIRITPTPIRVVCQNTLNLAIRMHQDALRIAHTPKLEERLDAAAAALAAITHRYRQAEAAFRAMARVKLDKNTLNVYLAGVFPLPRGRSKGDESAYVQRVLGDRQASRRLFLQGQGHDRPGIRETLWAAYNGVTQFVDHARGKGNREQRLQSSWFGDGLRVKERAFSIAEEMAHSNGGGNFTAQPGIQLLAADAEETPAERIKRKLAEKLKAKKEAKEAETAANPATPKTDTSLIIPTSAPDGGVKITANPVATPPTFTPAAAGAMEALRKIMDAKKGIGPTKQGPDVPNGNSN